MIVRNAKVKDAMVIGRNNVRLAKESEGEVLNPRTAVAGARALLKDRTKGFYLVAEDGGKVIGQCMVTFEWSDWRNKQIWWLQSVFVEPGWRRKGVFTTLFKEVRKRARSQKACLLRLYVHTSNRRAAKAYTKLGMRQEHYRIHGARP